MSNAFRSIWAYMQDSKAVSAMEYAIIVGVVVVGVAAAATTFSDAIQDSVQAIAADLEDDTAAAVTTLDTEATEGTGITED